MENTVKLFGIAITVAAMIAAVAGMQSCVARNWAFEDACRRAGGVVMHSSRVSASGTGTESDRDVCAKIVQSPIAAPIALPDYRK